MSLQFTENGENEFQDILSRYPNTRAALLPVLHLAQKEFGWISVEVMDYLAERMDLPHSKVLATATFYTMYNKQPVGKCHIQVCTTLSCAFRGGYEMIEKLEEKLNVRLGETTSDGKFTLTEAECLASCGTPPMFQLSTSDGETEYFENIDSDQKLDDVIRDLEKRCESLPDPKSLH